MERGAIQAERGRSYLKVRKQLPASGMSRGRVMAGVEKHGGAGDDVPQRR